MTGEASLDTGTGPGAEGPALHIDGLTAGYGDLTVLRDVSLTARPGELVLVAGANGAGKTTLLGSVAGTVRRVSGSVRLGTTELLGRPIHERTRAGVGLVPEGRGLFPSLSVRENLRVAAHAARLGRDAREAGIEDAVAAFPVIGERMGQRVSTLSGGQQQMVALGRALLARPRVLLLDEPSTGLAPIVWRDVLATCRRLADEGQVVVLVEQRIRQALHEADRCVVLQQGRVAQDAPAAAVRAEGDIARGYFASVLPAVSPAASADGERPGRPA